MTDSISNSSADAIVSEIIDAHARKVAAQTLRNVTPDEVVFIQALDFYQAITLSPEGFMHRTHVNHLMWILSHVSDGGLLQCADALVPFAPMTTPRQCFAKVAQKILKDRGVGRTIVLTN